MSAAVSTSGVPSYCFETFADVSVTERALIVTVALFVTVA